jgi:hypothetical protein
MRTANETEVRGGLWGKRKERLFNFKLPLSSAGTLVPITSSRHHPKNTRSRAGDEEAHAIENPFSLSRVQTGDVRGYVSHYVHPSGVQKQRVCMIGW